MANVKRLRPTLRTLEFEIISELMANAAGIRVHQPTHLKLTRHPDRTRGPIRAEHQVPQR